jgi:hypothetical protein
MANITVKFADGQDHIYNNVPDDVTPDQIEQRAAKDFAGRKVTHLDRAIEQPDQLGQDRPLQTAYQPTEQPKLTLIERFKQQQEQGKQNIANLDYGALKGASNIGATLLNPFDSEARNARKQAITEGLQSFGADPESQYFKGGELASEIAGTAGAGGAIAKGVRLIPNAAKLATAIESGGLSTGANAAKEFSVQGIKNAATRVAGGAIAGGAMSGLINPDDMGTGATLGGAIPVIGKLGGAAGKAIVNRLKATHTQAITEALQKSPIRETLKDATEAGYVVPPSYADGGVTSRLAEGLSGKYKTNQLAGIKNQKITDSLARKAVGLSEQTPLTSEAMQTIRQNAYKHGYEPVGSIGTVATDDAYASALKNIEQPFVSAEKSFPTGKSLPTDDLLTSLRVNRFNAGDALSKIQNLRNDASAAYASGNNALGAANKSAANALEDVIQRNLEFKANAKDAYQEISDVIGKRMSSADFESVKQAKSIIGKLSQGKITHEMAIEQLGGITAKSKTASTALSEAVDAISTVNNKTAEAKKLLDNFKDSRILMAKAHTVENAVKEGGGHVDAMKLAARVQSGKPMTGELATIGKFANNFGDVARIPKSGDANPFTALDFIAGGLGYGLSPYTLALPAARVAARGSVLSGAVQKSLAKNAFQPRGLSELAYQVSQGAKGNRLADLLANPAVRALPLAAQSK